MGTVVVKEQEITGSQWAIGERGADLVWSRS
jgi:hypothetical protein